jgi:hypothetical protein
MVVSRRMKVANSWCLAQPVSKESTLFYQFFLNFASRKFIASLHDFLAFIDGKWRAFNDNEGSESTRCPICRTIFGKDPNLLIDKNCNPGTSAYLLFCVRIGATVKIRDDV